MFCLLNHFITLLFIVDLIAHAIPSFNLIQFYNQRYELPAYQTPDLEPKQVHFLNWIRHHYGNNRDKMSICDENGVEREYSLYLKRILRNMIFLIKKKELILFFEELIFLIYSPCPIAINPLN
jgi:hypothetical protein